MATGTAYYNLTKPASTENYNLAVWNTNLDMIDAQMYQNETETFTGATSLANGTVGNVPAPAIADKDKYLKGDGTWDTPSGGGGGAGADEMTLAEYNELTEQQKNDGTIRFIPAGSGGGVTSAVDMSNLEVRKESAMAATATSSTETTITWNGGGNIGCTVWRTAAIDVTDYKTIKFKATNGTSYNSVNRPTNPNPDWVLQVGLQAAAPSGIQSTTKDSPIWEAVTALPLANHTYNGEIDVSELTGTHYLVINAHGCNTVIEDITLDAGGAYPSQIKYMSKTYAEVSVDKMDFTQLSAQQISDLQTALGIN